MEDAYMADGNGSPILGLQGMAESGDVRAQQLIDRYADLELLTRYFGENVEAIRAEYRNKFQAFNRIISNDNMIHASPSSYSMTPESSSQMVREAYEGLMGQMDETIRQLNEKQEDRAKIDVSYLTTDFNKIFQ